MSKAKTTMAGLKTPTKTSDKKVWDKPRKVVIFLMPKILEVRRKVSRRIRRPRARNLLKNTRSETQGGKGAEQRVSQICGTGRCLCSFFGKPSSRTRELPVTENLQRKNHATTAVTSLAEEHPRDHGHAVRILKMTRLW